MQASDIANNPLATLFTLSNTGPWTLQNVRMTCVLWNGSTKAGTFSNNTMKVGKDSAAMGNPNIQQLSPGDTATRDCGLGGTAIVIGGLNIEAVRIDLEITYGWFWGLRQGNASHHFSTRRIGGVVILVPDVETRAPFSPSS